MISRPLSRLRCCQSLAGFWRRPQTNRHAYSTSTDGKQIDSEEQFHFASQTARPWFISPRGAADALALPIIPAATFRLEDAAHGSRLAASNTGQTLVHSSNSNDDAAAHDDDGFFYSRWGSPTQQPVAAQMAALERAEAGSLLFSSGMAAISSTLLSVLRAGDHCILPRACYGGTNEFAAEFLEGLGVDVTFVDAAGEGGGPRYLEEIRPSTRLLYCETPANPTMRLTDIGQIGAITREMNRTRGTTDREIICACDGTFASPRLQRVLDIPGIDVSIQAGTKYLGGHSDLTAGIVSSNNHAFMRRCATAQRLLGGTLSAFDTYLLHRGVKTLDVRMERHGKNAQIVAQTLEQHPAVESVFYPGLPSHPDHKLAVKQFAQVGTDDRDDNINFGGMVSFVVRGGLAPAKTMVESLKLINLAVSLGSVESLVEHPASMTHTMVPREEREKAGILDGLIRLSVGLEDANDLVRDLENALDMATETTAQL